MPNRFDNLNLLTPEQLDRWNGLPVHWLKTPEGTWHQKFTPYTTVVALLDTGTMSSRLTLGGRSAELDVDAGSLALFNPGIEIKVNHLGCYEARRILLDLDVNALVRQGFFDDDLVTVPLQCSPQFQDPSLAGVLRGMVREIRQGCPNGTLFAESLSVGVALHLCRTRGVHPPSAGRERGKLSQWQWTRVKELIAGNLASDLSLSALSAVVGLSKPHFVRLFRNTTGMSPHRYVIQKRIERARQLVESSAMALVDVALEVGFASQSHLSRIFQETYGVTPGYARKHSSHRTPDPTRKSSTTK